MIRILLILFCKNNEQHHLIISNDVPTAFFPQAKDETLETIMKKTASLQNRRF